MSANSRDGEYNTVVKPESDDLSTGGGRNYAQRYRDTHVHGLPICENTVQRDGKEDNLKAGRGDTVFSNIARFVEMQVAGRIDWTHSVVRRSQHQSRDDETTLPYVAGQAHAVIRPCSGIGELVVDSLVRPLDGPRVVQSRRFPFYLRVPECFECP